MSAQAVSALPAAPPIDSELFAEITRDWRERAELIDGEIHVLPAPTLRHQAIVGNLTFALERWTRAARDRGMVFDSPIDVQLSEHDRVQPDVAWWRTNPDLDVQPSPPPDLAIEVLSPSTRRRDVGIKRLAYEAVGVAELWLVDPTDRTITVIHRSDGGDYAVTRRTGEQALTTPLMPGLELPVGPLFPA